jgi:hypothetical protein
MVAWQALVSHAKVEPMAWLRASIYRVARKRWQQELPHKYARECLMTAIGGLEVLRLSHCSFARTRRTRRGTEHCDRTSICRWRDRRLGYSSTGHFNTVN